MVVPGFWELVVIFGVVVLLFGGKKLPELGGALGESIKNFKKGVRDDAKKELGPGNESDSGKDKGDS